MVGGFAPPRGAFAPEAFTHSGNDEAMFENNSSMLQNKPLRRFAKITWAAS